MKKEIVLGYPGWRNLNTLIENEKIASEVSGHAPANHFVDVNKTINQGTMSLISQNSFLPGIDFRCVAADNSKHIRPLAVRPLTYSEGVPTPWGFSVSVADSGLAGGSCHD